MAAAVLLAAAVAVAALVVAGQRAGVEGVLLVLLVGVLLAQAGTAVVVLWLVRAVRRGRADAAALRRTALRREQRRARRRQRQLQALRVRTTEVRREVRRLARDNQRLHVNGYRQTQALLALQRLVSVDAAPPMGGWAASPDLVLFCVDEVVRHEPALVVECGSGTSTLFLALAAEQHGLRTRIVALEHQERFADATRALLDRHGVSHRAEVRLAPLQPSSVPGHATPWYAETALEGLSDIGMLLVDGPPTATGPQARYPAVPLLRDRLAPRCLVVMDDLIRPEDHRTAESWAGLLPDFSFEVGREFEKHVGLLRRG